MPTSYSLAERNILKTWILISGFLIFVIFLGWLISYLTGSQIILWIAVIYSIVTSFLSYWWSDKIVLSMSGAQPIEEKDNPELYRLVENLCLASGLPMPKIYIIPEDQPNAFATGRNPKNAAVAVTQGLLSKLERVELEGVLAHELSHIKNRDILLSTVVVILVGVVVSIIDIFFRMSIYGGFSRDREERGQIGVILLIISFIIMIISPILATILQLAISRKREFLADASAALMTRYPEGLARALEKISQDPTPMRKVRNSTSHLFISSPLKGKQKTSWLAKLFSTHPPVEERIKALREMSI